MKKTFNRNGKVSTAGEFFHSEKPTEWPDRKKRLTCYRTATKLDKDDDPVQVSTLVYALRKEAENILSSYLWRRGRRSAV